MGKKGVSVVLEQVMLFMISVFVFIACFSAFSSYEFYFTDSISRNQLDEVSGWVVSSIVGFSEDAGINTTIVLTVPGTIGGERYIINLTQEGLNITTLDRGMNSFTPLSRINKTYSLDGAFSTVHGSEFLIYKRENQIIIG